jgi:hypothetical protein
MDIQADRGTEAETDKFNLHSNGFSLQASKQTSKRMKKKIGTIHNCQVG